MRQQERDMQAAKVIAIYTHKGGTGKTVSAVNLAAEWALLGQRVLLIDLDPQANASRYLDYPEVPFPELESATGRVLQTKCLGPEYLYQTALQHLSLVAASCGLRREINKLREEAFLPEFNLCKAIASAEAGPFDLIVLDCPPAVDLITSNALYAADYLLVPCLVDEFSYAGLAHTLEVVEKVKDSLPDCGLAAHSPQVLICNRGREKRVAEHTIQLIQNLDVEIASSYIRRSKFVPESLSARMPLCTYAARSKPRLDYQRAAQELARKWELYSEKEVSSCPL